MTIRATVYIAADAVILIKDAEILAIRQQGWVEVWSADGETHMGNLPIHADELDIRRTVEFWHRGFFEGTNFGRDEAQAKLRAALGFGADAK